jgi:hypothetical protein
VTKKGVTTITDSYLDTSWTNTAFVNIQPDGPVAAVPEPSTWAMLLLGFAGIGYAGLRRSRAPISAFD